MQYASDTGIAALSLSIEVEDLQSECVTTPLYLSTQDGCEDFSELMEYLLCQRNMSCKSIPSR